MGKTIACCVVGCGRHLSGAKNVRGYDQYICGKHWRLTDKITRRYYKECERKGDQYGWDDRTWTEYRMYWDQLVHQAQDAAHGIG